VTSWVERQPAHRAGRSAGLDEACRPYGEGGRLRARHCAPRYISVFALGYELLCYKDDPVVLLVIRHPEGSDDPSRLGGVVELQVLRDGVGLREIAEEPDQVLGQHGNLLLLDLDGQSDRAAAALEQEDPSPYGADGADREAVQVAEIERLAHLEPTLRDDQL
jgi:hypothetical protein